MFSLFFIVNTTKVLIINIPKNIDENSDTHRLTRFGFKYLERYFLSHGVTITCIQQEKTLNIQQELVPDMIAIITSFSGRVHGFRSHKNSQKKKKTRKKNKKMNKKKI